MINTKEFLKEVGFLLLRIKSGANAQPRHLLFPYGGVQFNEYSTGRVTGYIVVQSSDYSDISLSTSLHSWVQCSLKEKSEPFVLNLIWRPLVSTLCLTELV